MISFNIFFGWRKASYCKKLVKQLQCRINLLKKRRDLMIRDNRAAFTFAGYISKNQNIVAVYELLDLMINLPYIQQNMDCPSDINEAASSLIHASARCGGELPELLKLNKLFSDRYGNRLNLVNCQLIQKLSVKSTSDDVKFRLIKEIAPENCLEMDPPIQTDIRCGHNRRNNQKSFLFNNTNETSPEELRFEEMGDNFQSQQRDTTSSSSSCSSHVHPKLPPIKRQHSGSSSISSSSSCSSHIHPKLPSRIRSYQEVDEVVVLVLPLPAAAISIQNSPEYDDLVAEFWNL
ncbi:hypothetical protein MKX01_002295 [Papaver californicum]|nr:hypothetical protein MKX01_002295 [Papaver californicum]